MKETGRPEWLMNKTRLLTEHHIITMTTTTGVVTTDLGSATTIHPGGTGMPRSQIHSTMVGQAMDILAGTLMALAGTIIMAWETTMAMAHMVGVTVITHTDTTTDIHTLSPQTTIISSKPETLDIGVRAMGEWVDSPEGPHLRWG
jgi:hypothetical protein